MDPNITIHNDFCTDMCSDDINDILSAVTALIAEAVLRSITTPEEPDTAA